MLDASEALSYDVMDQTETLIRRTVDSAGWRFGSQAASGIVLLGQSVYLARMLPVEVFGTFALAFSVVGLSQVLGTFGLGEALLHRCRETEDEQLAAAVHFTLTTILSLVWFAVLVAATVAFSSGPLRTALLVLGASALLANLSLTPRMILTRRVQHRRLATLQLTGALISAVVAVVAVVLGGKLWTLLAVDIAVSIWFAIGLWCWRPVFRPRIRLPRSEGKYFLRFGLKLSVSKVLQRGLDHIDKLWTGALLGDTALGFYSRARLFAGYPHKLFGVPIAAVASGVFAELKGKRERLSVAFFDVVAVLLRAAFLSGGLLVVVAPEIVVLVLGGKWLPMVDAFRLMLVFTLLEPINMTVARLFHGVGFPGIVVQTRAVQAVVMLIGLASLSGRFGIEGVAVSLGMTQLVGIGSMLVRARRFVDIALTRLFAAPTAAVLVGFFVAWVAILPGVVSSSTLIVAGVKCAAFSIAFALVLGGLERKLLRDLMQKLRHNAA